MRTTAHESRAGEQQPTNVVGAGRSTRTATMDQNTTAKATVRFTDANGRVISALGDWKSRDTTRLACDWAPQPATSGSLVRHPSCEDEDGEPRELCGRPARRPTWSTASRGRTDCTPAEHRCSRVRRTGC